MSHSICVQARQECPVRVLPLPLGMALAAAGIALYFLHFTLPGLLIGFSHDDLMNATAAARETYGTHLRDTLLFFLPATTYRPVGSLFYKSLFDVFGFTPLPYRFACYLLLAANLRLGWSVAYRLTHCRRTAFLATLLFAYHGNFWPLYQSTGFCYDLLCCFFYFLALRFYLVRREGGRVPSAAAMAGWAALYLLCLGSKEMAVSLPVVILCYEWLRSRPRDWTWLRNEGRVAMLGGAITALYLAGRMTGAGSLASLPAYRPDFRLTVYLDRAGYLFSETLYHAAPFWLGLAGALLLVAAILVRRRVIVLGGLWAAIGILPIAFIDQRGLAQAYLPAFGLALAAASAIRAGAFQLPARARGVLLFLLLPAGLVWWHTRYGSLDFFVLGSESRRIQTSYEQLETLNPRLPTGGSVLLVKEAFPENDWSSTFLFYLWSRDYSAQVARIERWMGDGDAARILDFDLVLSYSDGRLIQCDEKPFRGVEARRLAEIPCQASAIAYP